jgi:FKBP-type peptidyl-prolyl cis-trans isomerase FklB
MYFRSVLLVLSSLLVSALAGTSEEGLKWLAAKAAEEGVIKLPSGLLYRELTAGTGKTPTVDSPTVCHYEGKLTDGTEFDSSFKRGEPLTFAPNQVIKGWTEAMQLMQEGSKWELFIPSELGYGDRGAGGLIPGGAVLVFIMEMLEVKGSSK